MTKVNHYPLTSYQMINSIKMLMKLMIFKTRLGQSISIYTMIIKTTLIESLVHNKIYSLIKLDVRFNEKNIKDARNHMPWGALKLKQKAMTKYDQDFSGNKNHIH